MILQWQLNKQLNPLNDRWVPPIQHLTTAH
jgi:hypothetical protein